MHLIFSPMLYPLHFYILIFFYLPQPSHLHSHRAFTCHCLQSPTTTPSATPPSSNPSNISIYPLSSLIDPSGANLGGHIYHRPPPSGQSHRCNPLALSAAAFHGVFDVLDTDHNVRISHHRPPGQWWLISSSWLVVADLAIVVVVSDLCKAATRRMICQRRRIRRRRKFRQKEDVAAAAAEEAAERARGTDKDLKLLC